MMRIFTLPLAISGASSWFRTRRAWVMMRGPMPSPGMTPMVMVSSLEKSVTSSSAFMRSMRAKSERMSSASFSCAVLISSSCRAVVMYSDISVLLFKNKGAGAAPRSLGGDSPCPQLFDAIGSLPADPRGVSQANVQRSGAPARSVGAKPWVSGPICRETTGGKAAAY